ncbi:hypothetical protein H0H93_000624 [Arthromyces matolae]|nr:hypothetical protein H0H93_000624 [Arthromyces matolae]
MDTLWTWAIRQKASLANLKRLSAQKKLSKFYQDPERYPIPAKQMMAVLLTSIPAYNPSRPNDMSKMPWHGTKGTFQWKDPDDLKKVLSHVRKLSRMGTMKRNEFIQLLNNGSREVLVAKMDEAWKKWVNERLRTKIIHHRYRVANREAKATSSPLPGKE